jgi:hypothetical protein
MITLGVPHCQARDAATVTAETFLLLSRALNPEHLGS